MNQRTIISETERERILNMHSRVKNYNFIMEEEDMTSLDGKLCSDTLGNLVRKKETEYGKSKTTTYVVGETKGVANIKKGGKELKLTPGMRVNFTDVISLSNGSKIVFYNIESWGSGEVICENNVLEYNLYWN